MATSVDPERIRVGVVGTGFIARELFLLVRRMSDIDIVRALTRRPLDSCDNVPSDIKLTHSVAELIDHSDVVVECSGDVLHAAEVIRQATAAGLPAVTMNSEFHVTCGSHFVGDGYVTEAEGDQPGCTAALREDLIAMGFEPLVYGNMKGFLNPDPEYDEMEYWANKQGIRVEQTVSFTDGTKVQIEQAFVANAFGAGIAKPGMLCLQTSDFEGATRHLAQEAVRLGFPIADFVVAGGQVPGVFIVATHDEVHQGPLQYMKLGPGPHYTMVRPYHLCALEIPKTIRRVAAGGPPLLDNSASPTIGVAAVAKKSLKPGDKIELGVGSFEVRGRAVRMADEPHHIPIGLLYDATITRRIERGEMISVSDVDLPDSYARDIALDIVKAAAA